MINRNWDTIAFINNFFAWVIGDLVRFYIIMLQSQVVNLLKRWEAALGTIFRPNI